MTILSEPGAPLLILCAWCDFDRNDPIQQNASHGICNECLSKWLPSDDATTETKGLLTNACNV